MPRSASAALTVVETPFDIAAARARLRVPLREVDIAPENLRFGEPPDDDIPLLAETLFAAGQLEPLTVRPGRRKERANMALDGRRRLLALRHLLESGRIDDGFLVDVVVETDPARQAAAVLLTNTAAPVHVADVIAAIGRMLKGKLAVPGIAKALGYAEIDVKRLAALSALSPVALEALRRGRLNLRQARLLARLPDKAEQAKYAQMALDGHGFQDWRITEKLDEDQVTAGDARCALVGAERYAAAGGRTVVDLFGERAPVLLDPAILTDAWTMRAREIALVFEAEGLAVHVSAGDDLELPDDLEPARYAYGGMLPAAELDAYREAREVFNAAAEAAGERLAETTDPTVVDPLLIAMAKARIAMDQISWGGRVATTLVFFPSVRAGLDIRCFTPVEPEIEDVEESSDVRDEADDDRDLSPANGEPHRAPEVEVPEPETEGINHALLVFSEAGGTGRSYHADQSAPNQQPRVHYLVEPGWRADNAIQGLGRTHRTHQASAPLFRPVVTDIHGEKRFTSTIARRLDSLGALTRGERRTAGAGLFRAEDNLESPWARRALLVFYGALAFGELAAILHVLYTAEDADKTLLKARELLADLDDTAEVMVKALHRPGPNGEPETHPFIKTAVRGYAAMHDRFRTSVQGTARSYLKWLAGDDVERALSASDFNLGDLMCAEAPVSLYIQVAPADAAALRPLVRLLFYAAAQALTVDEARDAAGRPKRRRLLMLMDEFPLLGRVSFFEKSLRLLSGYGVKVMFVAQSLNDIIETYGANNTILDNCAIYTAFSALDPLTQDKVSKLTGTIGETRESRSAPAGLAAGRSTVSRSQIDRPLLEPGEVRALPDDLQLIFAAGQRPLRTRKLQYDRRRPFRERAAAPPPHQAAGVDAPTPAPHPWAGRRSLGVDAEAALPLFKEIVAAMDDKKVAARAADIYGRVAQEMAAQDAVLDHLKGQGDG